MSKSISIRRRTWHRDRQCGVIRRRACRGPLAGSGPYGRADDAARFRPSAELRPRRSRFGRLSPPLPSWRRHRRKCPLRRAYGDPGTHGSHRPHDCLAVLGTLLPTPSTTLLSAQEAKERLREIVEGKPIRHPLTGIRRGNGVLGHLRQIGPGPQVTVPKSRRNSGKFQTAV
jgi:hypothetical protein